MLWEKEPQYRGGCKPTEQLIAHIRQKYASLQPASKEETKCYCWIDVRTGNVAHGIDHCHHHETKHQADADVPKNAAEVSFTIIAPQPANVIENVPMASATYLLRVIFCY